MEPQSGVLHTSMCLGCLLGSKHTRWTEVSLAYNNHFDEWLRPAAPGRRQN